MIGAPRIVGDQQMTDRNFVLKWAHLGARPQSSLPPHHRGTTPSRREAHQGDPGRAGAVQCRLRRIEHSHIPLLRIAERYTPGRPRALRRVPFRCGTDCRTTGRGLVLAQTRCPLKPAATPGQGGGSPRNKIRQTHCCGGNFTESS